MIYKSNKLFIEGLGEKDAEECRLNADDPDYSDRMKGCFEQFQKSISDNKDIIGIVSLTIICFLVRIELLKIAVMVICQGVCINEHGVGWVRHKTILPGKFSNNL